MQGVLTIWFLWIFFFICLFFYFLSVGDSWKTWLVIQNGLQRSLGLLFQTRNPIITLFFKMWPENIPDSIRPNFKSQSELQCFTNSSEEQTEDAAEEKGYQKKAEKRKLISSPSFRCSSGWWDSIYAVAVAIETDDGLMLWCGMKMSSEKLHLCSWVNLVRKLRFWSELWMLNQMVGRQVDSFGLNDCNEGMQVLIIWFSFNKHQISEQK